MDKGAEMACDTRETKISHEVGVWLNIKSILPNCIIKVCHKFNYLRNVSITESGL